MTTLGWQWAVWAMLLVIFYGVLSRGLFLLTDSARQSLVDIAGELIDAPAFPESEKKTVRDLLETVYSPVCAWVMAALAIAIIFKRIFGAKRAERASQIPPMLQGQADSFDARWAIATIGNSLFACLIFVVAMLIIATLRMSFRAFTRAIVTTIHRDDHHNGARAAAH